MTYAFLLYPHANIRYRQSLLHLAVQELSMDRRHQEHAA